MSVTSAFAACRVNHSLKSPVATCECVNEFLTKAMTEHRNFKLEAV